MEIKGIQPICHPYEERNKHGLSDFLLSLTTTEIMHNMLKGFNDNILENTIVETWLRDKLINATSSEKGSLKQVLAYKAPLFATPKANGAKCNVFNILSSIFGDASQCNLALKTGTAHHLSGICAKKQCKNFLCVYAQHIYPMEKWNTYIYTYGICINRLPHMTTSYWYSRPRAN